MSLQSVQTPQPHLGQPGYPHPYAGQNYRNNLDVLKEIINSGLPVVHVFPYKLSCFSYLLFDIEEYFIDETQTTTELMLKVKNLGNGKYELLLTDNNCGMKWREELHVFDYTTVSNAVNNANTVPLVDISRLKGIAANTKVRFYTGTAPFTPTSPGSKNAIVQSVGATSIDLVDPITLDAGDKVFRGANLRLRCGAISNKYVKNNRADYTSYFQSIQASLDFETCDLSKDRAVYVGGNNPQMLVNADVNATFENLLKVDFLDVFLYAENQPQTSVPSQTMGLLTTLQNAQTSTAKAYIIDVSNAVGTDTDENVISVLIEYFVKAFDSGYYNSEPICAAINGAQLKHLMLMAPAREEYFGIQLFRENPTTHEGCRDYVSLRVHGIEIEHGTIEFVLFEPLNAYFEETPIMLLMPRSMVGFYQRRYVTIDSNLKVQETFDTGMYPRFKFKDISMYANYASGGDECLSFVTKLEFALARAGIFNDAYYVIKNAKSYRQVAPGSYVQSDIVVAA